jgi:glutamine amidotransferase
MSNICALGFHTALRSAVDDGVPLLGLCLGMQLLVEHGVEGGAAEGLGFLEGHVSAISSGPGVRVPHIGWNDVEITRPSLLFDGIESGTDFYFVHGYHVVCRSPTDVVAEVSHGARLTAAVEHGRVFGVQFHPEKSQRAGFALLANFLHVAGLLPERPSMRYAATR